MVSFHCVLQFKSSNKTGPVRTILCMSAGGVENEIQMNQSMHSLKTILKILKSHKSILSNQPRSAMISHDPGGDGVCAWDAVESFRNDEVKQHFTEDFGTDQLCDTGPKVHNPNNWQVGKLPKSRFQHD